MFDAVRETGNQIWPVQFESRRPGTVAQDDEVRPELLEQLYGIAPHHVLSDQFELIRLLGKGGMAVVYQALDRITYEHVALKIIRPDYLTHPMSRACLIHELTLARKLRHPNIVAVYDIRREDLQLYFSMEYIDGVTLLERVTRRGPMSIGDAVPVMRALCDALEHAHQTMVHCDVSLENIMIGRRGLRLLDFGIAKALRYDPPWKHALGKGSHTAPEQRSDALKVDARADIYSLGVVFFELLTKRTIPGPLSGRFSYPGLSRACCSLIEQTVVPLERRMTTVREVRDALQACIASHPEAPVQTRTTQTRQQSPQQGAFVDFPQ